MSFGTAAAGWSCTGTARSHTRNILLSRPDEERRRDLRPLFPGPDPPPLRRLRRLTNHPGPKRQRRQPDVGAGNRLAAVTDPAGRKIAFEYDAAGLLGTVTDPNGNTHAFTYTGKTVAGAVLGQVASQTTAGLQTWRFTYDDNLLILSKTNPGGYETRYAYDENHRLIQSTDPEGRTRTIRYDPRILPLHPDGEGRGDLDRSGTTLLSASYGEGRTPWATRPATATTQPEPGHTDGARRERTAYTYDGFGNVPSVTDPLGKDTTFTYSDLSQITAITDPLGNRVRYGYDARGNLLSVTDAQAAVYPVTPMTTGATSPPSPMPWAGRWSWPTMPPATLSPSRTRRRKPRSGLRQLGNRSG